MTRRDPFAELGLPADASPAAVKAAWRRLARTHHPDLASDRAEERAATRRMARINAAYEAALRIAEARRGARTGRGGPARAPTPGGPPSGPDGGTGPSAGGGRSERGPASGPMRAGRPVTRRVDTSTVFRPRGVASSGGGSALSGQPPPPADRPGPEALRGAPSGPLERHRPRRPPVLRLPDLDAARDHVLPFGKFHDRTLGEVELVEPTYIDWIVRTIRRDPELVASARVVQQALDDAGVRRTVRVAVRPDRPSGDDPD